MNTPNKLTLIRVILVPIFCILLLVNSIPHNYLLAGIIFGVAAVTDYFDGMLARKHNIVTDFGKLMDPVADKLLVTSALACFIANDLCSAWIIIIVLAREFLVTSLRMVAVSKGNVIAANMWGKAKTVSQMVGIIIIFVLQWTYQLLSYGIFGKISDSTLSSLSHWFNVIGQAALWIGAVMTIISGAKYMIDNKKFLLDA